MLYDALYIHIHGMMQSYFLAILYRHLCTLLNVLHKRQIKMYCVFLYFCLFKGKSRDLCPQILWAYGKTDIDSYLLCNVKCLHKNILCKHFAIVDLVKQSYVIMFFLFFFLFGHAGLTSLCRYYSCSQRFGSGIKSLDVAPLSKLNSDYCLQIKVIVCDCSSLYQRNM